MGLDSIFSILIELNQRDPELCAQALQQLLSLLQTIPPEGMIQEPKSLIQRMFELLRKLRADGSFSIISTIIIVSVKHDHFTTNVQLDFRNNLKH